MTKAEYVELRSELCFEPDPRVAWLSLVGNASVLAAGVWLMQLGGWTAYVLSQLVLAVGFFQAFRVLPPVRPRQLHPEPIRQQPRWPLGEHLLLPALQLMEAHPPSAPSVLRLQRQRSGRPKPSRSGTTLVTFHFALFAWRVWIPLVALAQHLVFWFYPIELARSGERRKLRQCAASIAFLLTAYAAIAFLALTYLRSTNIIPALVVYLVVNELVNLPHHTVLPGFDRKLRVWEQWRVSRSGNYPPVISEFFCLNFNFHVEHHLFPTLPWYRLRRVRARARTCSGCAITKRRASPGTSPTAAVISGRLPWQREAEADFQIIVVTADGHGSNAELDASRDVLVPQMHTYGLGNVLDVAEETVGAARVRAWLDEWSVDLRGLIASQAWVSWEFCEEATRASGC